MYRPPQNNNIVKSIRKKFESGEHDKSVDTKSAKKWNKDIVRSNTSSTSILDHEEATVQYKKIEDTEAKQNEKQILQRQFSDPSKRNIKRTPAFRVDRSAERTSAFQRKNQSTLYESKVKQFSAVKNNCDSNSNFLNNRKIETKSSLDNDGSKDAPVDEIKKLAKSKSSIDFQYVRGKFNRDVRNDCHDSTKDKPTDLYTEPIPKALRRNNSNRTPLVKLETVYNASTLKVGDVSKRESMTDSLKVALSRPLPKGPAPKKPPRAFRSSGRENDSEASKNKSFLHDAKSLVVQKPAKKTDPKYMLIKLEDAVRNNKLRSKKQQHIKMDAASVTSGEDDSDDGVVFARGKTNRTLPRLPGQDANDYDDTSAFNFNCLNGLRFAISNYEKIKEPNSCFFVGSPEEPVYAEPYHFRKDSLDSTLLKREGSSRSKQSARNSLYYMSTPVLAAGAKFLNNMTENADKQMSAENSSLSSFTSDAETASPNDDTSPSNAASPTDETPNIKNIIECYESRGTSPRQNGYSFTTGNRVENLKNSLRHTLDTSFDNIGAIGDDYKTEKNEIEKVLQIIKKFETYRQGMPKYSTTKVNKDTLFYCCLIIEKVKDVARIKLKYPKNAEIPQSIEHLCFPENESTILNMSDLSQNYSLLITNDKGERTYGYCRRVLPEGSTCCLPLTYCILSKYRAPRFYKKILVELESRHGIPNKYRDELIGQFYNQKFPTPGNSIRINLADIEPSVYKTDLVNSKSLEESVDIGSYVHVNQTGEFAKSKKHSEQIFVNDIDVKDNCTTPTYIVQSSEKNELVLTLHPDTRFEDSDLKKLHLLPSEILLKIFSSMLLERKVILISSMISNLSSCIDSLQSILYPFSWHHTCIPILPESLWDIVESPTPVLCGILSKAVVENYQIENGIVVDLDEGTVLREEGDECKILSVSMQKVWKRSITLANKAATSLEYVRSVYLSDAYLQIFIMCFKDYKKFFKDGVFQKEDFLKNTKSKGIRRFLNMFTETYMFLAFIDTILNTPENLIEFDKKISMYGSEDSNVILDKLLEWNR